MRKRFISIWPFKFYPRSMALVTPFRFMFVTIAEWQLKAGVQNFRHSRKGGCFKAVRPDLFGRLG